MRSLRIDGGNAETAVDFAGYAGDGKEVPHACPAFVKRITSVDVCERHDMKAADSIALRGLTESIATLGRTDLMQCVLSVWEISVCEVSAQISFAHRYVSRG